MAAARPHLAQYKDLFADPELWPAIAIAQHDEKDIYRTRGAAGLCDSGDGEAQRLQQELDTVVAQASDMIDSLKTLAAGTIIPRAALHECRKTLNVTMPIVQRYCTEVLEAIAGREAHAKKLHAKKQRLTDVAKIERLEKQIRYINLETAEVHSCKRRVDALLADVAALPAAPASGLTVSKVNAMFDELKELLVAAFGHAHTPASKALAIVLCSAMQCSPWSLGALNFTSDQATTWQMREMVMRAMRGAHQRGLLVVGVGADKAYASACHWDLDGYPKTRSAALREVEFFTKLVSAKSDYQDVSIKSWPRTADLQAAAEQLIADPRHPAAREQWMDDEDRCGSRERWRDFLLATGEKKMRVWLIGIDQLESRRLVDPQLEVRAPIKSILAPRRREIAEEDGCVAPGEKFLAKPAEAVKARLAGRGITHGTARLSELSVAYLRKVPEVRSAIHQLLDAQYRALGRDFGAAFSYPEWVQLAPDVYVPLVHFWDQPHGLKNGRMASANAMVSSAAEAMDVAAAAAAEGEDNDGAEDEDGPTFDAELFGDDQTLEDAAEELEAAPVAPGATLARLVGVAAQDVIDQPGQKLLHPKTMCPAHDAQHVPTARRLFSHTTADKMRELGHARAADWVSLVACEYESADARGFSRAARWKAWAKIDRAIEAMHPSLRWEPTSLTWSSPKTSHIEGYSRVLMESYLVSNDSSRYLDVMLGEKGSSLVYDRRKGSDLCESLFSRCVEVMRQDKVSKRVWLRMIAKIVRQTRRATMERAERRVTHFASQNRIYQDKEFVDGFRCCVCVPHCQIGGAIAEGCACAKQGRRVKTEARLVLRPTAHAQASNRKRFHVNHHGAASVLGDLTNAMDIDDYEEDCDDCDEARDSLMADTTEALEDEADEPLEEQALEMDF